VAFGVMGLPPAVFYDMSFCEWFAALDGLEQVMGGGSGPVATSEDFERMAEYMDPSESIRVH
jgi:hypothetical protein